MPEFLADVATSYLALDDYLEDYTRIAGGLTAPIWKLEQAQTFREPGNASWEAFAAGRWEEALLLYGETADELQEYFRALRAQGSDFFRVRVVAYPISSYLQWESQALQVRSLAGEKIRVVPPAAVGDMDLVDGRPPELVILGSSAGYAVDYGQDGVPRGATRFVDPAFIDRCVKLIAELYQHGEGFGDFFERDVRPLPPPVAPG